MSESDTLKVFLHGYIDVPNDRLETVKSALPEHVALTRAETGCINFEVVQCDKVHGRFIVSEIFLDQAAFDAHQERTRSSDWFKTTRGIPREYSITVGGQ